MANFTIDLPEQLRKSLNVPSEEASGRIKRELAIRLYQKELLSFGEARRLADMNKWEFHELLGKENIPRHYYKNDLNKDLKTIEGLS